jgi:hypothetical protein
MNRFSICLAVLLALTLVSSVATGETRDIRQSQLDIQHPNTLLWRSSVFKVDSDTECVNVNSYYAGTAVATCTEDPKSLLLVPKDWTITKIKIYQVFTGDANSECRIRFLDASDQSVLADAPVIDFDGDGTPPLYAAIDTTIWTLSEGDIINIEVSDQGGVPNCSGSSDPQLMLDIYGKVTN